MKEEENMMRKSMLSFLMLLGLGFGLVACGQPPGVLQCTGIADCTADTACIDGQCKGVYGREYQLTFDSAKIPEKKANGNVWDTIGGLPDAYCEFRTKSTEGRTGVQQDTLNPSWDSTSKLTLLVDQTINFTCHDKDIDGSEKIFEKSYKITPTDVRNGTITLNGTRGFTLNLKIRHNLK